MVQGRMLNQWLLENETKQGEAIYLRQPRNGQWYELSWKEVMQQARQVARLLEDTGLKKGSHVAIFSKNCAEWFISDFGISLAGMVSVPLFPNQHQDNIQFILEHAEIKLVFVGKLDDHQRMRAYLPPNLITVSFDYHKHLNTTYLWADVLKKKPLEEIAPTSSNDLFTIIYSSGTSGDPKGAVYTHGIIANYLALFPKDIKRIRSLKHYHLLSYLPLAHVYERSTIEIGSVTLPCDVSFIENLDKFADNLRQVQPTFFTAVPRVWGIFQQKIEQKLSSFHLNYLLNIPGIAYFIQKKIKRHLGLTHCTNCFSGASHLPISIFNFFDKLDIKLQEGYGQTENLAYATFSVLDKRRPGYVGTARTEVSLKLTEENELMIKSPCLMKAYYKDKEATERALTFDGWLHSGDIARIDENNNVKILGRLSENFKNQKGEFIAPSPIEKRFLINPAIAELCMIGKELPSNVLILTLSELGAQQNKTQLKQRLQKELRKINRSLAGYEKISHIIIAKGSWSPNNGFLTPTLKVKRPRIEQFYHDLIRKTIAQSQTIVWES